jgi:hypothetical protein
MEHIDSINSEIVKYNENMDQVMSVVFDYEYCTLYLDGKEVTSGDNVDVFHRIKQINRENGLNYL